MTPDTETNSRKIPPMTTKASFRDKHYIWSDETADQADLILWDLWVRRHLEHMGADKQSREEWDRMRFSLGVALYELFQDAALEGIL